jgi:hypothetical protein
VKTSQETSVRIRYELRLATGSTFGRRNDESLVARSHGRGSLERADEEYLPGFSVTKAHLRRRRQTCSTREPRPMNNEASYHAYNHQGVLENQKGVSPNDQSAILRGFNLFRHFKRFAA